MADKKIESGTPWLFLMVFTLAVLKLANVIQITWFWVFTPVLIPLAILAVVLFCLLLINIILKITE